MTTAPLMLRIYQHDSEVASHLIGQQSIGAIVSGEMIRFLGLDGVRKQNKGQMNQFNAIIRRIEAQLGTAVTLRRDLYNYFAANGKTKQTIDTFHTVKDADAEAARLCAHTYLQAYKQSKS